MIKYFYELYLFYKDLKSFEKVKTLKKDDKEDLNTKLLRFNLNNF